MKKLSIVLLLCLAASVYADHGKGAAVGGVLGSSLGGEGFGGNLGVNFKLAEMPLFFAAYIKLSSDSANFGVTADKYFIDETLLRDASFDLDWYLGGGAYMALGSSGKESLFSFGARLPVGLSWHINREFELFIALVPSAGLTLLPQLYFPDWFFAGELGLRYWLNE